MSKERELLKTILAYMAAEYLVMTEFEMITQIEDTIKDIQELLAQPEQTKRSPLTEAEISKTLKLSRRSTEWDYGFEAGVRFAEEFHGIEL